MLSILRPSSSSRQVARPEALDTARRALELAKSKARRRYVAALAHELRGASDLDQDAELALARALQLLEPPTVAEPPAEDQSLADTEGPAEAPGERAEGVEGDGASALQAGLAEVATDVDTSPLVSEPAPPAAPTGAEVGPEPAAGKSVTEPGAAEPESTTVPAVPPPAAPLPDPMALRAEADDALDRGDEAHARYALLEAARAHAASGQYDAAIDACHLALVVAPDDPDLHLELVDLYLLRGWHETAAEKLLLLDRLLALDGNETSRARLRAIVVAAFPDEPSLADIRS